ncbi:MULTISPECIES: response regulator [Actinoalloteichus]|uniref:Two component transcriptional regulator, LuxR family n=1 Tax=Actinoalloteichus fjordicus TaxID=1612552 RepID=A0AAC9LDK2_9PSEU|nr:MULTISPECIES: response regulator transcription factor [Actinoalloteichus]APU16008.1 two component transcriptional regulator, LuxR family [Actinoalloteichus fjordicus]APU22071.1 two component transcriptional regulator, LuxR family [Actinoalloteichus sp. GBA129-24]
MIRVLVVDDEPMVCGYLGAILADGADVEVLAPAHDGAEAVEASVRGRPHVVLLDLRMPGVDGLTALPHLRALPEPPAVIVLTTFDSDAHVLDALRAGAAGFLAKTTPPEDLLNLVRVAADGHAVLSSQAMHGLLRPTAAADERRRAAVRLLDGLTEREREILTLMGEGLTNAAIGRRLHLSEPTIKGYVSRILLVLDCANRTQAVLVDQRARIT